MAVQEVVRPKKRLALVDALPTLLDQLRNQGFKLGAAEYQEAHALLIRLAQHGKLPQDPARLRTYLAPLLCASPAEHSDFRDIFSAWAAPFAAEKTGREKPVADAKTEKAIRRFRFRVWLWTPIFLLTAVLLIGIAFWWIGVDPFDFQWPSLSDWPKPDGWIAFQGKTALTIIGVLAGLAALALIVREAWLYLTIRRYLKRRTTDAPFDVQPFFVETRPGRLFQTIAIKRAAQTLRRHLRMPAEDLDIPATVEATASECGRFSPVKGFRYHAPEYLALVDRAAFRDHQAEWVDALIDRLAENDVAIRRYYFNRDPRSCVPDSGATGPMNLMDLAGRYADHRLIIFADADILTDPFTGKPPEWIEQFYAWEQRGLMTLTPMPEMENGGRTPSLAHDFIVMPVDEAGLTDLIDRMNGDPVGIDAGTQTGGETVPPIIAETEPSAPRPSDEAEEERLIGALKGFVDPEGWHWLCACAVYPDLRWGLTLHLGQNLTGQNGRPLLNRDRLLRMIRLPWFRHGIMPDWLRQRLIDDDAFRGIREREVRRELFSLMRTAGETGALRMEYARIDERLIPRIVRAMRRLGEKTHGGPSPLRDGIFLDFMANPLSVRVPLALNRFIKRYWKSGPKDLGRYRRSNESVPSKAPDKRISNALGMTFVYIPPGTFMMGSPEDEPKRNDNEKRHEVTLTRGFYMQTTQVTQAQWRKIMGGNPSDFKDGGDDCPVENVSWEDVQGFIEKLNNIEETDLYRLPTEAEWEYACRAGTDTPFFFGDCLSTDQANYNGNYPYEGCPKGEYRKRTTPVGSLAANALYDMHGNLREWCQDWFGEYPGGPVTDPVGPPDGSFRVVRGGSWINDARNCRSAARSFANPDGRSYIIGFRLARCDRHGH